MARRKIVVAMSMHETNTFSPVPTPLGSFRSLTGQAAIEEFRDTNTQLGGFLQVAQRAGAEIAVPIAAGAHPSGHVEKAAYEEMAESIVGAIRGGCDAAFLALHGAMVAEHHDDGEGELLRRIRAVAPRLPIAVGLDFHAHLTARMVENATVITGYRTYPHVDMAETAARAGRTLFRALDGEVAPVMIWGSRPMMTSTLVHTPARQPMKDIMDMAIAAETSGAVLNASVFGGFPHADIPHISCSAVIVCDRRTDAGQVLCGRLLDMAWDRRADFLYTGAPLASQVAHARTLGEGPIVLVDHGDNTASGGTQDVMSVIAEVMRQGLADVVAGPIADPASVARIMTAGTAASVTLPLGGKVDMPQIHLQGKPLTVTGKVTPHHRRGVRGHRPHGHRHPGPDGEDGGPRHGRGADRGLGATERAVRCRGLHPLRHRPAAEAVRPHQVAAALPGRLRADRAPHRALRRRRRHELRPPPLHLPQPAPAPLSLRRLLAVRPRGRQKLVARRRRRSAPAAPHPSMARARSSVRTRACSRFAAPGRPTRLSRGCATPSPGVWDTLMAQEATGGNMTQPVTLRIFSDYV